MYIENMGKNDGENDEKCCYVQTQAYIDLQQERQDCGNLLVYENIILKCGMHLQQW